MKSTPGGDYVCSVKKTKDILNEQIELKMSSADSSLFSYSFIVMRHKNKI